MRSYGQYCGVAKALDVIGDRWSLLIVRELLIRDGLRYTDLRDGLPGIASNLLAERLRQLEQAGVVEREEAPPPVATTLFHLTARGRELRPAVHALGYWGGELLSDDFGPDAFQGHWLALPLEIALGDRLQGDEQLTIEVRTGGEVVTVEVRGGDVRSRSGAAAHPDAIFSGTPRLILATLIGKVSLDDARARGMQVTGEAEALERILPRRDAELPVHR
jgi:DNA-binding HxlR family transcriptional regulator